MSIETSQSIGALAGALAKAQAEVEGAAKDRVNPHFKSSYATLASVWEACRVALSKNGIAVVQSPVADNAAVTVTTLLAHSSGEWMRSALTASARDATPQSIGSAVTYLRRYGLASMVGVAPEDDDGEQAVNHNAPPRQQVPRPAPEPPLGGISDEDLEAFESVRLDLLQVWPGDGGEDREQRLGWYWAQFRPTLTAKVPADWSPAKSFAQASPRKRAAIKQAAYDLASKSAPVEREAGQEG
jgi:hypothetical protein